MRHSPRVVAVVVVVAVTVDVEVDVVVVVMAVVVVVVVVVVEDMATVATEVVVEAATTEQPASPACLQALPPRPCMHATCKLVLLRLVEGML